MVRRDNLTCCYFRSHQSRQSFEGMLRGSLPLLLAQVAWQKVREDGSIVKVLAS
jgi:hypothetical protein